MRSKSVWQLSSISRREALVRIALLPTLAMPTAALAELGRGLLQPRETIVSTDQTDDLPTMPGVRQRTLDGVNGISMRVLEAGYETPGRRAVLLLHGFPEIAYSWRKVMLPLAESGYHVIAPDQCGYGGTTGWDDRYDGEVASFRTRRTQTA